MTILAPFRIDNPGASSVALWFAAFLTVLAAGGGCAPKPLTRITWETMGTFASITLAETEAPLAEEYGSAAKSVCREIEERMSRYREGSEISEVNRLAGEGKATVSPRTAEVLRAARWYAEASGGAFDPTVGPLVRLWGFSKGKEPERVPDEDAIRAAMAQTGYGHLAVSNGTAWLDRAGMSVDLGGIAKGYAVDVICERLNELGAKDFLVNIGGNIRCYGRPRRGRFWTVGVRNPFVTSELLGRIRLTNGMAVATSGNYEKFVTIGGRKYAHILDPRTGRPVEGMAGVTVVTTNGVHSDGLSTSLFVLGVEESVSRMGGAGQWEAIFVPDREPRVLVATPGFREMFAAEPEWAGRVETVHVKSDQANIEH